MRRSAIYVSAAAHVTQAIKDGFAQSNTSIAVVPGMGGGRSLHATPQAPPPPPPRGFERQWVGGMVPTAPPYFCMAPSAPPYFRMAATGPPFFSVCFFFIGPSMLLSARYCKTRRYTNVVCGEVLSAEMSKTALCKGHLLLAEAFRAKPRPECSAKFFPGRTHHVHSFCRVSSFSHALLCAPGVGVRDSLSTLCCVAL